MLSQNSPKDGVNKRVRWQLDVFWSFCILLSWPFSQLAAKVPWRRVPTGGWCASLNPGGLLAKQGLWPRTGPLYLSFPGCKMVPITTVPASQGCWELAGACLFEMT